MPLSQDHSALWSSLITLESVRSHTAVLQPYQTYFPIHIRPAIPDLIRLNTRNKKLTTAVAFIGASLSESKTTTACSSEFSKDVEQPVITLRIVQNQPIVAAEMEMFRDLLNALIGEVLKRDVDWNVKKDRHTHIHDITEKFLLPLVVTLCRTRISSILSEPYSKPFRTWYSANCDSASFLDPLPADLQDELKDYLWVVNFASDTTCQNDEAIILAILGAHRLISAGVTSTLAIERQWTRYDVPAPTLTISEENLDDYETLDYEERQQSTIHRFLHKLERYYTACRVIVRELATLRRSGHNLNIVIDTVPVVKITSAPSDENEYPDLDSFLSCLMTIDPKTLESKKLDRLRKKWGTAWKKGNLVLHAEMQLALFYATNPQILPVQGYIGASKKCCWCCDFVLKRLQNAHNPSFPDYELDMYTEEATGSPLIFSVRGTHGNKHPRWIFPNPSQHIKSHTLDSSAFLKVCRRFELVREDMQRVLIRELLPKLRQPNYYVPYSSSWSYSDSDEKAMADERQRDYQLAEELLDDET